MRSQIVRADRLTEIQSAIGKAPWQIQAFENTLAHFITIALKLPPHVSLEEAQKILDNTRSKTLGHLIEVTKKNDLLDEGLEKFMSKFLSERNWLVHRSWSTHADFLEDNQTFVDLRYKILRVSLDAIEFNKLFTKIIESWVRKNEIKPSEIVPPKRAN